MTTFPHGHYNSRKGHTLRTKTTGKNWISMTLHQRNNCLHCILIKKERSVPSTNLKTKWQSIPNQKIKSDSEHKNLVFTRSSLDLINITSVKSVITAPQVKGHSKNTRQDSQQSLVTKLHEDQTEHRL